MYKVVFLDIDGTIRNSKKEITVYTKTAIKRVINKGTQVVICTGRSRDYAISVSKEALASPWVIVSDGAYVYDYAKQKDIYTLELAPATLEKIYNITRKYNISITVDTTSGQYTNDKSVTSPSVTYQENFLESMLKEKILHVHIVSNDKEKMTKTLEELEKLDNIKFGFNGLYQFGENYFIFLADPNSNKGDGIKNFCKYFNISIKETVGIGDDFNDLAMFKNVGVSVAMGNAQENIKKVCTYVTDTNDNDGVAKWLNANIK